MNQPFVAGSVETPVGKVPQISSSLKWEDRWGTVKARWGVGRMNFLVDPGLYAIGNPDKKSPVFVTANYKMSFDCLREALGDHSGWILVLDTKGINVWCAAGKGTFGTEELVRRIQASALEKAVDHRELILPQLGAPGVAAHLVKKLSGFRVIYGPIRAKDIPAFLAAGLKATPQMRQKSFTLGERAEVVPIEFVQALRALLFIVPVFFILGGFAGSGNFWANSWTHGLFAAAALLIAVLMGAVLTPLLLPFIPGRAFAVKGFILGTVGAVFFFGLMGMGGTWGFLTADRVAWLFLIPALSAYLGMNFTGASTFTSLSGVKKEMRWAVPLEITGGALGLVLWFGSLFLRF